MKMKRNISHKFEEIISINNLLLAWQEFVKNKKKRSDVRVFSHNLMDNIISLHQNLNNFRYKHANYEEFHINDPKPRIIHKATVCDRLLHHAIYRVLMPLFDKTFIFDSYSCRKGKGTHRAFERLVESTRKQSKNYTKPCWALKCDVKKFFHSVDHVVLVNLLSQRIADEKLTDLLKKIIESFESSPDKGMPLGNLTSQLFANIYLDPLDKFIKHQLKVRNYLRYADDFMLLADNKEILCAYLHKIEKFLRERLKLIIHPDKIIFCKLRWGVDFVGYVAYPKFNIPRGKTVKRMLVKLEKAKATEPEKFNKSLQSYLGYLKHVNSIKISNKIRKL